MKVLLKYSGIISAVLAIVAFILLLATPGVNVKASNFVTGAKTYNISGTTSIFGGSKAEFAPTWAGLLAFILILVALLILCCAIVLPLLKIKASNKVAGALNLVAVIALILAGVFAFCVVAAFKAANGDNTHSASLFGFSISEAKYVIGAGWVIAGILSICAGVFAILPAAADFVSKK